MAALEPLQSALVANGVRVVFMSSSEPWQTKEFLSKSVIQFPGKLFSDPTLQIHKAFKLQRGIWQSLVTPLWPGFKRYGLRGIVEGFRLGMEFSKLVGDSWQQGGTFVLSSEGKVMFGYCEDYPGDWKAMDKALGACGVNLNIDYHAAIKKWLSLREISRSTQPGSMTSYFLSWIALVLIICMVALWLIK